MFLAGRQIGSGSRIIVWYRQVVINAGKHSSGQITTAQIAFHANRTNTWQQQKGKQKCIRRFAGEGLHDAAAVAQSTCGYLHRPAGLGPAILQAYYLRGSGRASMLPTSADEARTDSALGRQGCHWGLRLRRCAYVLASTRGMAEWRGKI